MLEGQDIRLAMDYIQLSGQLLANENIKEEDVRKAAAELATKSLTVLKDSLVRAGANMAGIITG